MCRNVVLLLLEKLLQGLELDIDDSIVLGC